MKEKTYLQNKRIALAGMLLGVSLFGYEFENFISKEKFNPPTIHMQERISELQSKICTLEGKGNKPISYKDLARLVSDTNVQVEMKEFLARYSQLTNEYNQLINKEETSREISNINAYVSDFYKRDQTNAINQIGGMVLGTLIIGVCLGVYNESEEKRKRFIAISQVH